MKLGRRAGKDSHTAIKTFELLLGKPHEAAVCIKADIQVVMKPESSSHKRRNQLLILVVILSNVIGNVTLGHGMRQTGAIVSASPLDYLKAFAQPWTVIGVVVLAGWMISNLALLSRADLSFVLPVTAAGYVLIALAGRFWLGEHISSLRWVGIAAIALGVILAEETPSRTTDAGRESPLQAAGVSDETNHANVHRGRNS